LACFIPLIWFTIRVAIDDPAESSDARLILNPDDNLSIFEFRLD